MGYRDAFDPGVDRFPDDEDEYIVTNAARAISDGAFVDEAIPGLARILSQDRFTNMSSIIDLCKKH